METVKDSSINYIDFEKMNLKELISYCKEHKITRYSNKNKGELISYIKNNYVIPPNANTEDLIVCTDIYDNDCNDIKFTREYMKNDKICLVCGDCLDVMRIIPDKSIDLCLTDPPYNIARNNNFSTMGRAGIDFGEWDMLGGNVSLVD
jgi:hypothetical protein